MQKGGRQPYYVHAFSFFIPIFFDRLVTKLGALELANARVTKNEPKRLVTVKTGIVMQYDANNCSTTGKLTLGTWDKQKKNVA
jgi:hypothetical protein